MFVQMRSLFSSIRELIWGKRFQARLADELQLHLELLAQENRRRGMPPDEAWRQARLALGGFDQIGEACRQARGLHWLEDFVRDVRYGCRQLSNSPGFTIVSVLILALGIGANTAIFSLVNALFLRPLPADVKEPSRLVWVFTQKEKSSRLDGLSYPGFKDLQKDVRSLSGLTAFEPMVQFSLQTATRSERTWGALISANLFDVMGIQPFLGRAFSLTEEQVSGAGSVVLVSHRLWRQLGGNSSVIGRSIRLNRHLYTIVGVAPERFTSPLPGMLFDIYVPLGMREQVMPGSSLQDRTMQGLQVLGRLSPGFTREQAQSELNGRLRELASRFPDTDRARRPVLTEAGKGNPGVVPVEMAVAMSGLLMAIAAVVLLTACTNLSNLLKARASARQQEITMRVALGASRSRIIRQLLTEGLLLAAGGAALGLILGCWIVSFLHGVKLPVNFPLGFDLGLDRTVLVFTAGAALLALMLSGLFPALYASRPDIVASIKGVAQTKSGARFAPRRMRMLPQIAMSCLLLVVGGSLLRGLQHARSIHPGFETANCLTVAFDPKLQGYTPPQAQLFYQRLQKRLEALPNIQSVCRTRFLPLGFGKWQDEATIPGFGSATGSKIQLDLNFIGQGYFRTMGIPLVAGRDFTANELRENPTVAIINETLARRFWPNQDPLDRHIRLNDFRGSQCRIVGVAKDSSYYGLGEAPVPFIYLPLSTDALEETTLCIRTFGNSKAILPPLRAQVQFLDPNMPIFEIKTMAEHVSASLNLSRGGSLAAIAYGLLGLMLASVGVYGVVSYSIRQRTREIGIRLALGQNHTQIVRHLLIGSMKPAAIGIGIGLAAAFIAGKFLSSVLHGVAVADPLIYAAAAAITLSSSMIACYLPARRASRLDPMSSLRVE